MNITYRDFRNVNINITYWDFGNVNINITYWDFGRFQKNTPWWELCTHLDRKILFQSLECAKDKKYHLPVPKWDFFMWGIKMISI